MTGDASDDRRLNYTASAFSTGQRRSFNDLDGMRIQYDIHTMASEQHAAFVTSRLGVKSQTVLPKEVRAALQVGPGDQIGYSIRGGRVTLTAVRAPQPQDDPFACFEEWGSEADTDGYGSL